MDEVFRSIYLALGELPQDKEESARIGVESVIQSARKGLMWEQRLSEPAKLIGQLAMISKCAVMALEALKSEKVGKNFGSDSFTYGPIALVPAAQHDVLTEITSFVAWEEIDVWFSLCLADFHQRMGLRTDQVNASSSKPTEIPPALSTGGLADLIVGAQRLERVIEDLRWLNRTAERGVSDLSGMQAVRSKLSVYCALRATISLWASLDRRFSLHVARTTEKRSSFIEFAEVVLNAIGRHPDFGWPPFTSGAVEQSCRRLGSVNSDGEFDLS